MEIKENDPGALAGAHRVPITQLAGRNDLDQTTSGTFELQVRSIVARFAVSRSLAAVIAVLAFSSGRQA